MKAKFYIVSILIFFLFPSTVFCLSIKNRIKVRNSVVDKNAIEKPAEFAFITSIGDKKSFIINSGISVNLIPETYSNWIFFGPSIEYHKNTELEKKQDVLQVGITSYLVLGDITESIIAHVIQPNLKYKNDNVKSVQSIQTYIDYIPLIKNSINMLFGPKWLKFIATPSIGLEMENMIKAASGTDEGNILKFFSSINFAIYPGGTYIENRLEFSSSFSSWYGIFKNNYYSSVEDFRYCVKTSLIYYFDEDKHFAIGIDYVFGENPREGMKNQNYFQGSFKVKF